MGTHNETWLYRYNKLLIMIRIHSKISLIYIKMYNKCRHTALRFEQNLSREWKGTSYYMSSIKNRTKLSELKRFSNVSYGFFHTGIYDIFHMFLKPNLSKISADMVSLWRLRLRRHHRQRQRRARSASCPAATRSRNSTSSCSDFSSRTPEAWTLQPQTP